MVWREQIPKQAEQIALTSLVSLGLFVLLLAGYFGSVDTMVGLLAVLLVPAFICPMMWISNKRYRAMRAWRVQIERAAQPSALQEG